MPLRLGLVNKNSRVNSGLQCGGEVEEALGITRFLFLKLFGKL
jgi:hypothetical protein